MKALYLTMYRYRDGLDEDDLRELTRTFAEVGQASGVLAHYSRLDNKGGFVVQEVPDDPKDDFKVTITYAPWIDFEVIPITTIEEAFPVIQSVYG
jgi:hypothetical protein